MGKFYQSQENSIKKSLAEEFVSAFLRHTKKGLVLNGGLPGISDHVQFDTTP